MASAPEAPSHLKAAGKRFWSSAFSARADWIIPEVDYELVKMAAEHVDAIEKLRKVFEDPEYDVQSNMPHFYGLRSLRNDFLVILKALGFTPAERARLELTVTQEEDTPLQRIMRERQHKKAA